MKTVVTVIVVILCLAGFLRLPIAGAADMCIEADDSGYLDINDVNQEQTSWCWVASANAVTNRFRLTDPQNSNTPYTQCRLYNIAKAPGVDCCMNPDNGSCQSTGWPWEVFQAHELKPNIDYDGQANPMSWLQIKAQICPNWSPSRPFIFIAQPHTGGLPHTHVVKGFGHDNEGNREIFIDDHFGNGASFIDYECKYKLPANCQESSTRWDRVGDIYNLHTPPRHPDITVQPRPELLDPH